MKTTGGFAFTTMQLLLSPEDQDLYQHVSGINSSGYAVVALPRVGPAYCNDYWLSEFVHRYVMRRKLQVMLPPRLLGVVEHINHNKADCRRENLRLVTQSQNLLRSVKVKSATGFLRVYLHQRGGYKVQIKVDNSHVHVGFFQCLETAALMADAWTYRLLSEEAKLNFPERLDEIASIAETLQTTYNWKRG